MKRTQKPKSGGIRRRVQAPGGRISFGAIARSLLSVPPMTVVTVFVLLFWLGFAFLFFWMI